MLTWMTEGGYWAPTRDIIIGESHAFLVIMVTRGGIFCCFPWGWGLCVGFRDWAHSAFGLGPREEIGRRGRWGPQS